MTMSRTWSKLTQQQSRRMRSLSNLNHSTRSSSPLVQAVSLPRRHLESTIRHVFSSRKCESTMRVSFPSRECESRMRHVISSRQCESTMRHVISSRHLDSSLSEMIVQCKVKASPVRPQQQLLWSRKPRPCTQCIPQVSLEIS